jgi:uncharacterized protein involved in exopolysaccharide biosynthesis
MNDYDESRRTLRDVLYIVFRHKGKMAFVFFAVIIGAAAISLSMTPSYRASAKLLVKLGRENIYMPNTFNPGASPVPVVDPSTEERISSEVEILKARDIAENVIRKMGIDRLFPDILNTPTPSFSHLLGAPPTPMQAAVLRFQNKLRVQGIEKSDIIQINFEHQDAAVAAKTLEVLVNSFLERHIAVYKQAHDFDFFDRQTRMMGTNLVRSEASLQTFRDRHDISALQEQKAVLLRQASEMELDLAKTRSEINENRGRRQSLERSSASNKPSFGKETDFNVYAVGGMKGKIADLRLREEELRAKYPEGSYLVQAVRKEIEKAEQILAKEEKTYHDKEVKTIGHTIDALGQKENAQKRYLAQYQAEIRRITGLESQLSTLERQRKINEDNYQLYVKRTEEGRISDAMDNQKIANISIVEHPLVPIRPVRPNVPLNMMLAVVLGIFSSVGAALAAESFSGRIRNREDVKNFLALPVLASLPELKPALKP